MTRKFTGWHMSGILVAFFGVVMVVNFTMAAFATSTFGGVQVENSYVASQKFNQWLAKADEQAQLDWQVTSRWQDDGHLQVSAQGAQGTKGPSENAVLSATARHPLGKEADQELTFTRAPNGDFVSNQQLSPARWIVRLRVLDGDVQWRREDRF